MTSEPLTGPLDEAAVRAAFMANHHPDAEPSSVELASMRKSIRAYLAVATHSAAPAGEVDENGGIRWFNPPIPRGSKLYLAPPPAKPEAAPVVWLVPGWKDNGEYGLRPETVHPVADTAALDALRELAEHKNWELDWGAEDPRDEEFSRYGWRVHKCTGGRNDREWTLIGFGTTPLEAINRAALSHPAVKGGA